MKIEQIIYETTRNVLNLEDKLSIATIFLFCEQIGTQKIAELLYNDDLEQFIDNLQDEYSAFEVDFSVRLDKRDIEDAFFKTLEKYKEKNDSNGFLKAVYEKDPFALVICDISNYNFNAISLVRFQSKIKDIQLKLF